MINVIMKGKKRDIEFLSQFISRCISQNINNPDDIANIAKHQIEEIDNKIKEVEQLKQLRPKLLDVIYAFNKKNKDKIKDAKILFLHNITNLGLTKIIIKSIKERPLAMNEPIISNNMFCIKQLIDQKIIYKCGDFLVQGANFKEYYEFILNKELM